MKQPTDLILKAATNLKNTYKTYCENGGTVYFHPTSLKQWNTFATGSSFYTKDRSNRNWQKKMGKFTRAGFFAGTDVYWVGAGLIVLIAFQLPRAEAQG